VHAQKAGPTGEPDTARDGPCRSGSGRKAEMRNTSPVTRRRSNREVAQRDQHLAARNPRRAFVGGGVRREPEVPNQNPGGRMPFNDARPDRA
jgi:hypothetical protein